MTEGLFCNLAVLARELRTRMRGRRAAVVITLYLLLLSTLGGMMLYSQMQEWRSGPGPGFGSLRGSATFRHPVPGPTVPGNFHRTGSDGCSHCRGTGPAGPWSCY